MTGSQALDALLLFAFIVICLAIEAEAAFYFALALLGIYLVLSFIGHLVNQSKKY